MAKLDFLSTGYSIIDEPLLRTSSTALRIGHDLIMENGFEIWTGLNKSGTKLTITTDYVLSAEIPKYTTEVGSTIYSKLAIVNGAYLNVALYVTYTTVGDLAGNATIKEIAWPIYKTAAQWTADNTVLEKGQTGIESDTGNKKIGDGTTAWNTLTYEDAFVNIGSAQMRFARYSFTMPAPGASTTATLGIDMGRVMTVSASAYNQSIPLIVPSNHIATDGSRTEHFVAYVSFGNIVLTADLDMSNSWTGKPVQVIVEYI